MSEDDARYVMNIAKATVFGVYEMLLQLGCTLDRQSSLLEVKNETLERITDEFTEHLK